MTKPKYIVEICNKNVSCLGEQLVVILQTLIPHLNNAVWYASDISATTKPPFIIDYNEYIPKKIGNTLDVIELAKNVNQFLSGVFLAFPNDKGEQITGIEYGTEDEYFRDIDNAIVEIRAFDTDYYLLSSRDDLLISKIANSFDVMPRQQ